jgi:hypothetical protein
MMCREQLFNTTSTSRAPPEWMADRAFHTQGDVEQTEALRYFLRQPSMVSLLQSVDEHELEPFMYYSVDEYENVVSRKGPVTARHSVISCEMDHEVPFVECNETRLDNLHPLHGRANCRKGSKLKEEVPYARLACGVPPVLFIEFLLTLAKLNSNKQRCKYWKQLKKKKLPKKWKDGAGAAAYVENRLSKMQKVIEKQQQQEQWLTLLVLLAASAAVAGDMSSLLQVMPFFFNSSSSSLHVDTDDDDDDDDDTPLAAAAA